MDIVFIIESSDSIPDVGSQNWDFIIEFVVQVIEGYNVGESATRFGLVMFSSSGTVEIYLDDYFDKASLLEAVRAVQYVSGRTNTADGLQLASEDVFDIGHGDRSDVGNVAIVITYDDPNERESDLVTEADALKQKAQVIVIGITDQVSTDTVDTIATNSETSILVNDFNELASEWSILVTMVDTLSTTSMYISQMLLNAIGNLLDQQSAHLLIPLNVPLYCFVKRFR